MDPVAVPAARAESTILRVKMPLGSKSYLRPRSTCATRSWAATARIRLNCCELSHFSVHSSHQGDRQLPFLSSALASLCAFSASLFLRVAARSSSAIDLAVAFEDSKLP